MSNNDLDRITEAVATNVGKVPYTSFERMRELANELIDVCEKKDGDYSSSWCRRGGIGAFFAVWRKVDRLEAQMEKAGYNIFDVTSDPTSTESLDETIKDLVAYMLLVLEKREAIRKTVSIQREPLPTTGELLETASRLATSFSKGRQHKL